MVSFDGRAAGTPVETWDADERLDHLPGVARPVGRTVVVAAHPDDETLGAGGLLHALAVEGRPAEVVVVTDGGGSHPGSSTLSPGALVRLRADEVTRAVALLSPASTVWLLGFPDGAVREHREGVTAALRDVLGPEPVAAIVSTWRGDGHRDHRIVGEICAALAAELGARHWEYPLWMWHWGTPDHPDVPWDRLRALPLDDRTVTLKRRAVAGHRTQTEPWSRDPADVAPLHPAFLRHFDREVEVFVVDDEPTTGPGVTYFDAAYERRDDPWRLATRWYEQRKRALTIASLPAERFGSALEIGSSIGMLTAELAPRCDRLLATDLAARAVASAAARVADQPHVTAVQHDIRDGVPDGPYDLVVLSEVGYYLTRPELLTLARRLRSALTPVGVLVACHWRHPVDAHAQPGDDVHLTLDRELGLTRVSTYRDADVALDVWSVAGGSVAQREGLVP
ncbi:bifunctional PIG-L family deacetylase/class I SAM-dependent methyltransferase [Cellulomonas rhizosphaerae]|uniref:Methyltransferase domain-containing protein n=1 Tax=Cellulomonas rhizosphaerae TaxID=2293719 RepID=A0A413RQ81_9CELL|nr:bifunctional PIG-L family deacetylase/class I SAM-dependent methyltransferase [Cellulomonas rhizosphaerae]RHA44094.1 methyltransferase domain-containing protein [Cellulomonas rhizosphaerae]